MMRPWIRISLACALAGACTPGVIRVGNPPSVNNPYPPQTGDAAFTRGEVFLNAAHVLVMESYPLQFALVLNGDLPTPCHQLRAVIAAQ